MCVEDKVHSTRALCVRFTIRQCFYYYNDVSSIQLHMCTIDCIDFAFNDNRIFLCVPIYLLLRTVCDVTM